MPRGTHQPVDTHDPSETTTNISHSDSVKVPIAQRLQHVSDKACEMCGSFKNSHPTMTTALMLVAVFSLGIVTSAAVGKLFVSQNHYYVSTDPSAREIHQALDTLIGHYRSGKDYVSENLGMAKDKASSAFYDAKGSAKDHLTDAQASAQSTLSHAKDSLLDAKDTLSSRFSEIPSYANDKLVEAKDSILAAKETLSNKLNDALHPERHENHFMKMVHEAEHKIANFIKHRGK